MHAHSNGNPEQEKPKGQQELLAYPDFLLDLVLRKRARLHDELLLDGVVLQDGLLRSHTFYSIIFVFDSTRTVTHRSINLMQKLQADSHSHSMQAQPKIIEFIKPS